MQFSYSFTPWPDETWDSPPELFRLFRLLSTRIEDQFTEEEFGLFRERVGSCGITLREVERVPYVEPEPIYD